MRSDTLQNLFSILCGVLVSATGWSATPGQFSTRAIWVDPPSFATPAAADKMIERCAKAGFNLILPNVMSHQSIRFKSEHFAGRVSATAAFDPLAYVVEKAHARGMKVQAWCCVYYEGSGATTQAIHPDWLTISLDGKPFSQNFLSPANPAVNPYLLAVISDLLSYKIDGIHLDYIRYPGTAFDYSPAGRKECQTALGFDPQDFLDRVERIVPVSEEKFPIRVLHPAAHAEKVWEVTATERTLDQAGFGFGFVSESPEAVASLRTPGLLIISSYYEAPEAMISALKHYVSRGGNVLWSDLPGKLLNMSADLRQLSGIESVRWRGQSPIRIKGGAGHPLAKMLPKDSFRVDSVSMLTPSAAEVVATLETGEPAVTVHTFGKGHFIVPGFHMVKSSSPAVAGFARTVVDWARSTYEVTGSDRLGEKRAEWVAWRAAGVSNLVWQISARAKQKNPALRISSSAGPIPAEFYSCYRDGGRWLAGGINDELFPMNYTPEPAVLAELLDIQTAHTPPGKFDRIFPGLQIYKVSVADGKRTTGPAEAAVVEQQLRIVKEKGYRGFCLFAYNTLTDEILEVVRGFSGGN